MKNLIRYFLLGLNEHGFLAFLPDKAAVKLLYRLRTGRKLELENPTRYNEKLQWIKLYDRNPIYTKMADKYLVRDYISEKIGDEYLIPLLGKWDRAEDIDFSSLPEQFVLKCNHDSGSVVICRDRAAFDEEAARKKLKACLKKNGFRHGREWPYKDVPPCIIAEKCMTDESGCELGDYKILCFGGVPRLVQIHRGRFRGGHTQNYYDTDMNPLDIYQGVPLAEAPEKKPEFLDEMLRLSAVLSEGIPHVRVDWYHVNGHLYFGELTFFDASGFDDFEPDKWNETLGSWIELPEK